MSLDISLIGEENEVECTCTCGHEHTRIEREYNYESNITHNLGNMANEAGMYNALWRPEENDITHAKQLIPILEHGIHIMKLNPSRFKPFSAPNGWGTYEQFIPWLQELLEACKKYPESKYEACR